jgi:hypothetical protein
VLALLSEIYWGAAVFFSVIFVWQLLGTLFGHAAGADHADVAGADAAGAHDAVGAHDAAGAHGGHDAQEAAVHGAESVASFKLLSIRSVVAFGVLFGWAGVLYTKYNPEGNPNWTMLYSILWGLVGMLIVSSIFYFLRRMTETGTPRLSTCVGQRGTVYMDIPAGGTGKVRTVVSNTVSFVGARAASGEALAAGTPVVVKRLLDSSTVEVEKARD